MTCPKIIPAVDENRYQEHIFFYLSMNTYVIGFISFFRVPWF